MAFSITEQGIIAIPVFLFSLVVHEYAHAWTAMKGGDSTAAYLGRLSFNPLVHLDPIGTLMIVGGALTGMPLIGWAKPVPVNTLRFRNMNWMIWVALAGPASNLVLALVATVMFRGAVLLHLFENTENFGRMFYLLLFVFVFANVCLMLFNMIPIPPLDGSKVFFQLFIKRRNWLFDVFAFLEQYGFMILLVLFLMSPLRFYFSWAIFRFATALLGPFPYNVDLF